MYAVIASGGKQYRVEEGQVLDLEKLPQEAGDKISFDQVLMVADGDNISVGAPYVANAAVDAEVVEQTRGEKVEIIKFKRRKHHMKRQGHRQYLTKVKITGIKAGKGGAAKKAAAPKADAKAEAKPKAATKAKAEDKNAEE